MKLFIFFLLSFIHDFKNTLYRVEKDNTKVVMKKIIHPLTEESLFTLYKKEIRPLKMKPSGLKAYPVKLPLRKTHGSSIYHKELLLQKKRRKNLKKTPRKEVLI